MDHRRIFILGSSLLTSGLARLLGTTPGIEVVGNARTADEALPLMNDQLIDALVVMGTDDQTTVRFCPILAAYPDLPIIRADISQNAMQLITSRNIEADPDALLAAIAALPKRG
jgi:DNA-binding NarL/FixJ family response regulator